ncbi:hypothetical protein CGZ91_06280 [Parenemella sanctibonifatiensis]|uniref:Uncharacterized protein n=1 Tax=Parenemella sanctibonifatiensis TaxID=2016505 RepID=A0A255EPQ3_9ACTN|nr:hypothetical protein CGZ91_06280 [Parenemella sanctibonifatiensis]
MTISGVIPHLSQKGGHVPRTEAGIGALMPWAERLWFTTYPAHGPKTGTRTGLFSIDDDFQVTVHEGVGTGTYANRMIHDDTDTLVMGPHLISTEGEIRVIDALVDVRLAATTRHLHRPETHVYMIGMEGDFYEVDVTTAQATRLGDLCEELDVPGVPHFKDAFCNHGRLVVVNNSYYHEDFPTGESDGRLAEWDGTTWIVIARTQMNTVSGRYGRLGDAIHAVGQDRASAVLWSYLPATGWVERRLPKATHTQDHAYTTEWPRLREVESERWLLDASGMFYEVPAMHYNNAMWGVRPIASHLRIIGDFCTWNGLLVLAGDQGTPIARENIFAGQPQANLWFGKTDDLWQWGPRAGWGGPWWDSSVTADQPSSAYLMTGFVHKSLQVTTDQPLALSVELDFRGDGSWVTYDRFDVDGYRFIEFPDALSAHWVRLRTDRDATVTAQFSYL